MITTRPTRTDRKGKVFEYRSELQDIIDGVDIYRIERRGPGGQWKTIASHLVYRDSQWYLENLDELEDDLRRDRVKTVVSALLLLTILLYIILS